MDTDEREAASMSEIPWIGMNVEGERERILTHSAADGPHSNIISVQKLREVVDAGQRLERHRRSSKSASGQRLQRVVLQVRMYTQTQALRMTASDLSRQQAAVNASREITIAMAPAHTEDTAAQHWLKWRGAGRARANLNADASECMQVNDNGGIAGKCGFLCVCFWFSVSCSEGERALRFLAA